MSEARGLAEFLSSSCSDLELKKIREVVLVLAATQRVGNDYVNAVVVDKLGRELLLMVPVVSTRFSPLRPLSFPHARVAPACIRDADAAARACKRPPAAAGFSSRAHTRHAPPAALFLACRPTWNGR